MRGLCLQGASELAEGHLQLSRQHFQITRHLSSDKGPTVLPVPTDRPAAARSSFSGLRYGLSFSGKDTTRGLSIDPAHCPWPQHSVSELHNKNRSLSYTPNWASEPANDCF